MTAFDPRRSFKVFVNQGSGRAVLRKGGGVVPAECMVPNNIARSHASDLDFFITSKPFYSTSCGIDLPMFEE
jgi:hypothetical protein